MSFADYGFAIWETFYVTVLSTAFSLVLGLPLGVLLVAGDKDGVLPLPGWLMHILNIIINILRSVPFLILMICVFPLTRAIVQQGIRGIWDYHLAPVYTVCFMDFVSNSPMLKEFRTDLVLTDLQTRQRVSDRMRIVYLQLPLFDKHTEAECMDIFDCWIYIVKNMNMFEQMPFSEKYPVFRKLAEIGDLRKLSREELELYDEDIKNMRDIYATRKFDEKKGMEIGMAKGMEKEKLATARRLLSMGLSDEQVSTATELPLEEIQKLKE